MTVPDKLQTVLELLQWAREILTYLRARYVCRMIGHHVDSDMRCESCDYNWWEVRKSK